MKSKKSQSHVEVMISLVLFVGAVLFIFLVINPFAKTESKQVSISQIQDNVLREISVKIGKLPVVSFNQGHGNSPNNYCYNFDIDEYKVNFNEPNEVKYIEV